MTGVIHLLEAVAACWSADTSSDLTGWDESNPAYGQDVPTALVLQDYLGGEIWRLSIQGKAHLLNHFDDGTSLDATISQYGPDAIAADGRHDYPTREELLAEPVDLARYTVLKDRVARWLTENR